MWEHFINAGLSRVTVLGEWGNVWRCSAKTLPSYCWGCVCQSPLLLFFPFSLWNERVKGTRGGRRSPENVVDESKQYTTNLRFPWVESQQINLNRSLNYVSLSEFIIAPAWERWFKGGHAISSILFNTCLSAGKDLWAKPSAGEKQCGSNEIAGATLHITSWKASPEPLLFWRSSFGFWVIDQRLTMCLVQDKCKQDCLLP